MAVLSRTLLFVFLAALLCLRVDALKCYSCSTAEDAKCSDPEAEGNKFSVECSASISKGIFNQLLAENETLSKAANYLCYNAKLDVDSDVESAKNGILRGCTIYSTADICDVIEEQATKMHYCGTCSTDLCNSAKGLRIPLFTSIVCLFAAFLGAKVH